mmetsp:Transcript_25/g.69  ORF Transcript_25/g.69 Transcript_25/m.69 type:complete len:537 (-) Transcript_25:2048-3658(-)
MLTQRPLCNIPEPESARRVGGLEERLVLEDKAGRVGHRGDVSGPHLLVAHRALVAGLQGLQEWAMPRREEARGAVAPIVSEHAKAGDHAEGRDVLAIRAIELRLDNVEATIHARRCGLARLLGVIGHGLAHNVFDLLLVLVRDLRPVLWAHQRASVLIGVGRHLRALALDDHRRKDRNNVCGELLDVLRNSQEHDGGIQVVAILHKTLHNDVGMEDHETAPEVLRQRQLLALEVLVGAEEQLVGLLVVPHFLLLLRNDQGCVRGLHVVAQGLVQAIDIVGVFGDIVRLTHEVVDEGVCQGIAARAAHDLDGTVNLFLTDPEVEFQGHAILLAERIVLCCVGQVVLLFVVLGDSCVLLPRALFAQALLEGLHLIVALREVEGLLVVLCEQEELHSTWDVALAPAILCHPLSTRWEPGLAHQLKGPLGLVEALEAEAHDAVEVPSALIGNDGLAVSAARLLGLGVLQVELRRVDLAHERGRGLKVEVQDVEGGGLIVGTRRLIELCRLHILPHLCQDLCTLLADSRVLELRGNLHAAA